MRLFQIGDVRLYHDFFHDKNDLSIPRNIESISESFSVPWSARKIFGFGGYAIKSKSFSFDEILFSTSALTVHQRVSQYMALLSRPMLDIFAYIDRGECQELDIDDRIEEDAFDDDLFWIHTTGQVRQVTPNFGNDSIKVEIDYNPTWEVVNRYLWQFVRNVAPETVSPSIAAADDLHSVPKRKDIGSYGGMRFSRVFYDDALYMYDPDVWESWHLRRPIGYPITGWGTNLTTITSYSFTVSRDDWSAPPRSMYQWTNLPTNGGITLSIYNQDDVWGTRETTAVLNLDELNNSLSSSGYTGIDSNDRVIIADYHGMNSFIIRNNEVLEGVNPKWIYDSEFLGQTGFGVNRIMMSVPDISVENCQLHTFRMM